MPKRSKLSNRVDSSKGEGKKNFLNCWKMLRNVRAIQSWMNNVAANHQFLGPINEESISNKHAKNDIVNNLAGKQPPEIF